ncbi:MAG: transposase [Sedimentisphaerales bacterium]|nr:transposase [Sedimentisphaerales bacterium]
MLFRLIGYLLILIFKDKQNVILENLALRQQLIVQKRSIKRHKIRNFDRIFWVWLSKIWKNWKKALLVSKPATVISWHKKGFKLYWKFKSRRVGRPNIDWELIKQIRKTQKDNPLWSVQRIQGELIKLGYSACVNTVAKYMKKPKPSPGKRQRWRTFLKNHAPHIVGIDFFVVRTAFFKALYVFVAISHDRRKILHVGVTSKPHSQWAIQQLRETFAFDDTTKYVVRDNDKIFSYDFQQYIKNTLQLQDTPTAYRSSWQNPHAERVIGTLRRECLDNMIILNESHLRKVLDEFVEYYNTSRTHMSLNKDSPVHRPVQAKGRIVKKPVLGGLHHIYSRVA